MAINSYDVTCEKKKFKRHDPKSPYLTSDRVQLLSRVTEKRVIQKKTMDYISSFPLAVNIYKANSDEFKSLKRAKKKIKKSVLTLPNEPSPKPQVCTVSDMNDSEYYSQNNDNHEPRMKKRSAIKNVRKSRVKNKDFEFYDRDARYCSELNINLDSSSTDLIKDYKGDGKRLSKRQKGYKCSYSSQRNKENEGDIQPHDVWTVLRNMKRFQFKPSPPVSDESILPPKKKKKKCVNKRVNCKDTRVIETTRTEEFAYISSFNVDDSSRSLSQTSSFDRITVINKKDEFSKICKQFEKRFLKTGLNDLTKNINRPDANCKIQKKRSNKGNAKPIGPTTSKENNTELKPYYNDLGPKIENEQLNDNTININILSSLLNIENAHNIDQLEQTSVCSRTNNAENELKMECPDLVKESCTYSIHSGSSKAEMIADETNNMKAKKVSNGRVSQLRGISRVFIGKKCEPIKQIAARRLDEQKRKSHLVNKMPNVCAMPKLTNTEIKRRLANMKFPIVILGKDQVSSSIEVQNYDHSQFDGLDKQIWPFMMEWDETNQFKREDDYATKDIIESRDNNAQLLKKCNKVNPDCNLNKFRMVNNEVASNMRSNYKSKKHINGELLTNKYKSDLQRQVVNPEINKKLQPFKKQESITNIKDKMLNLLYKKLSDQKIVNDDVYYNNCPKENTIAFGIHSPIKKVDTSTEIQTKSVICHVRPIAHGSPDRKQNKKYQRNVIHRGHPWAKAKWASDFIENVIRKIKTGVYYSQNVNHVTEISIQTEPILEEEILQRNFSPKITIKKKHLDVPKCIPGFESSLTGLEIKTLNMNQISIKHCIANVMMQFDISVPGEAKPISTSPKTSISLIPVEGIESYTKVFKCKTSIFNAMLPAELCSILPKMMSLFDSDMAPAVRPPQCSGLTYNKKESHLSTIRETSPIETVITQSSVSLKSSLDCLPHAVRKMLGGIFLNVYSLSKDQVGTQTTPLISYDAVVDELLPKIIFKDTDILTYCLRSFVPVFIDFKETGITSNQSKTTLPGCLQKQRTDCTALELYNSKNKRLVPPFQPYDFVSTIRNILMRPKLFTINLNLMFHINTLKIIYNGKLLDVQIGDKKYNERNMLITMSDMKIGSLLYQNKEDKHVIVRQISPKKCVEYLKQSTSNNYENKDQHSETDFKITNNKIKRKGCYRMYRKCKSTTNITNVDKCINTPLNKIQTLEDFFQIIGSKRMISSIFDGYAARKILASIAEMKNWVTDINPKQALLILLLINKKDTPNLVRFRPVLLQGIAVNRITRATELDMEIEVIERENLNKLSQYEGISYLPGSVENHDQLLEELYWIAKTTASDYQRPFDESSEKLLRSLLEKRKKLNPSYLRVMARYVGLGLLKSPTKK